MPLIEEHGVDGSEGQGVQARDVLTVPLPLPLLLLPLILM